MEVAIISLFPAEREVVFPPCTGLVVDEMAAERRGGGKRERTPSGHEVMTDRVRVAPVVARSGMAGGGDTSISTVKSTPKSSSGTHASTYASSPTGMARKRVHIISQRAKSAARSTARAAKEGTKAALRTAGTTGKAGAKQAARAAGSTVLGARAGVREARRASEQATAAVRKATFGTRCHAK